MSIYIGNDLEDRLEVLKAENASLRKYNEYRQIVTFRSEFFCFSQIVHESFCTFVDSWKSRDCAEYGKDSKI